MINLFYFALHLKQSTLFYSMLLYICAHDMCTHWGMHTHTFTNVLNYDLLEIFEFKFENLKILILIFINLIDAVIKIHYFWNAHMSKFV